MLWMAGGCSFFFFNDTATTEIYTLSLHDALPISDFAIEKGRHLRFELGRVGDRAVEERPKIIDVAFCEFTRFSQFCRNHDRVLGCELPLIKSLQRELPRASARAPARHRIAPLVCVIVRTHRVR